MIDRELPGFAEIMRSESYKVTPHGIISRGICGIRKESIIINLPGSEKAATENLGFVLKAIPHALAKIKGDQADLRVAAIPVLIRYFPSFFNLKEDVFLSASSCFISAILIAKSDIIGAVGVGNSVVIIDDPRLIEIENVLIKSLHAVKI